MAVERLQDSKIRDKPEINVGWLGLIEPFRIISSSGVLLPRCAHFETEYNAGHYIDIL